MTVNKQFAILVLILGGIHLIKFTHGEDSTFLNSNNHKNKTCEERLQHFSGCTKNFIDCVIHNAEPVTYCRQCGNPFSGVIFTYDEVEANETCKAVYFNQDRLNVLQIIYSNAQSLWEAGSCSNCFDWVQPTNENMSQNISSTTHEFFDNLKNLTVCKNSVPKDINVCDHCAEDYNNVNALYNSIKESTEDNFCFDIKDAMNKTRLNWSRDLKCCKDRKSSLTAFIVTSVVLSGLIPFAFYTGFMFLGWRREQLHDFLMDSDHQPSGSSPTTTVAPITSSRDPPLLDLDL